MVSEGYCAAGIVLVHLVVREAIFELIQRMERGRESARRACIESSVHCVGQRYGTALFFTSLKNVMCQQRFLVANMLKWQSS